MITMHSLHISMVTTAMAVFFASTQARAQRVAADTTDEGPEIAHTEARIVWDGVQRTCAEQAAQAFLIRKNMFSSGNRAGALKRALDYRTENYGRFPGFGAASLNTKAPKDFAKDVTFVGLPIQVNSKMAPALACVEAALTALSLTDVYKPRAAGGLRFKNTYRGLEVSNHVFGIAIDIESERNSCCSCVEPWPRNPLCKKKVSSIYERMAMPRAWVIVFERYGFYWLGHDALQDTMHFEFLGSPEKIFAEVPAESPNAFVFMRSIELGIQLGLASPPSL
jgi:D-alanyl-D-alanine carboxypeptidase